MTDRLAGWQSSLARIGILKSRGVPGEIDRKTYTVNFAADYQSTDREPACADTCNGLSSEIVDSPSWHAPVLDIDIPAYLVPSATEGHSHLYIDKHVLWDDYVELLKALARCGIIEDGYANVSIERGATFVRMPDRPKGEVVPA